MQSILTRSLLALTLSLIALPAYADPGVLRPSATLGCGAPLEASLQQLEKSSDALRDSRSNALAWEKMPASLRGIRDRNVRELEQRVKEGQTREDEYNRRLSSDELGDRARDDLKTERDDARDVYDAEAADLERWKSPAGPNVTRLDSVLLEAQGDGVENGFEIEPAGDQVRIWRVVRDSRKGMVRVTTRPFAVVDRALVHPTFFETALKGRIAMLGANGEREILPFKRELKGRSIIVPVGTGVADPELSLFDDTLDLGCRDSAARGIPAASREKAGPSGVASGKVPLPEPRPTLIGIEPSVERPIYFNRAE